MRQQFIESLLRRGDPEVADYRIGTKEYLQHGEQAKQAGSIPIIGSLNGSSDGGWNQGRVAAQSWK